MNSRNENKYNLSDIQMAEFVSRGYLIFNSVIDDKTNKLFLNDIGHSNAKKNLQNKNYKNSESHDWIMKHYDNIMKTSSIPLVKAGTSLKKSYKKNSALNKVIKNPIIQGAIKSLVGKNPLLDHHFLHITFPSSYYARNQRKLSQSNHNDCVIDPRTNTFDIQLFYFPTEVTQDMGGTRYIPGSHFRMVNESAIGRYHNLRGQKHVVCPAGTVIIFHHNIWHGAGVNNSDQIRYAFKIRLMPTEKQIKLWTKKNYKNKDDEEPLYWNTGLNNIKNVRSILQETQPWFEADTGRLDIINRIKMWRYISDDKNFDAAYWLTRIENELSR